MTTQSHGMVYPAPDGWQCLTVDGIRSSEPSSCVAGPFGSKIASRYFSDEGVPVIRGCNLRDDLSRFVVDGFVFVSEEKAQEFRPQHVRAGDLVFTCWGTVGQVGLIPKDGPFDQYIISNKQLKLRVNPELADPEFCFYYFASPRYVEHVRSRGIGGAVPGINLGILKSLQIALPSIDAQRRIAAFLNAYDDLINNNSRRIKLLEESARLLFDEWFVHLRFPGHLQAANLDGVPAGWQRLPLEQVLFLQRGFDLPIQDREDGPVPIYGATGINGFHNRAKVPGPGIVTGRAGSLGVVHFVPGDFWPLNTSLWVKEFRRASPRFAVHLLRAMTLDRYGQGATMPMLDRKVVHQVPVLLPAPDLMARFESFATDVYDQIDTLQRQNQQLTKARDLLLPRLMSGQLTVRSRPPGLARTGDADAPGT